MPQQIAILETMPSATDFYRFYWNRQPFVVRSAIPENDMKGLISAEELAALSMEETSRSRMIRCAGEPRDWSCRFGPFTEQDFAATGDSDWSLLVQNVEQFHTDTSALLHHFSFTPRWLMDDIMTSFSAPGGTVGPHIDSYHVFLVQGQGRRRWKVSHAPILDESYIPDMDIRVLATAFEGSEIEVACGDVLYVPPRFGHEGATLENALTYSVGFLGPKLSELFSAFGQYLSEREETDRRYVGDGLNRNSAGFLIDADAADSVRTHLAECLNGADFTQWLVEFFTRSSHEDFGEYAERDDTLSLTAFRERLKQGASLHKPTYVKFAVTGSSAGEWVLGFDSHSFALDSRLYPLVRRLMEEQPIDTSTHPEILDDPSVTVFLLDLHSHQALELTV